MKKKQKANTYQSINKWMDNLGKAMIMVLMIMLLLQFLIVFLTSFKALFAHAQSTGLQGVGESVGNVYEGGKQIINDTATDMNPTKSFNEQPTTPHLSVPVGEFGDSNFNSAPPENWLGAYIVAWYNYVSGAIGIIAVVMVMWGGILWITSGGNSSQISEAKDKIKNAIIGIVLLLLSYTIFKTVNPDLLNLSLPKMNRVQDPVNRTIFRCHFSVATCPAGYYQSNDPSLDCENNISRGVDPTTLVCCCEQGENIITTTPLFGNDMSQAAALCDQKLGCSQKKLSPVPEAINLDHTQWNCACSSPSVINVQISE